MTEMTNGIELNIYYDGLCPLCSKEIDIYRNKKGSEKIHFVDIAHPNFDAQKENLDPVRVHKSFHIKKSSGEIIDGVDAFVAIWECLDIWKPLQSLAKSPICRPLLDLGYLAFAKTRPIFRRSECETNTCGI